ncbi:MAG: DUF2914 domain-containing protein [Methylococcaceae bacterium]
MAGSNKVVIKINYQDTDEKLRKQLRPERVTEWNVRRILLAVLLLMIFIIAPFYYFSESSPEPNKIKNSSDYAVAKTVKAGVKPAVNIIEKELAVIANESSANIKAVEAPDVKLSTKVINKETVNTEIDSIENIKKQHKPIAEIIHPPKVINNAKVARALLTTGINNKEPLAEISSPILVNKNKATSVYYFTEIRNMKGHALFHHWLRGDVSVYKREIKILGNRWRASTGKTITYYKAGVWRVTLESEQGVILNEIQFNVIQE